jgi:enoyl-CoA hydratase/3-hydroxyacyl-CoA dehydrogenase
MICLGRPLKAVEAADINMVSQIVDDYPSLISAAVETVNDLQGKISPMPQGKIDIPKINIPAEPKAGKQVLSKEAVAITMKVIKESAAAENFNDALEIGYKGFGEIACTDAAEEGISAFLERRPPVFIK